MTCWMLYQNKAASIMRRILPPIFTIMLLCVAAFPQKRSNRESAGINGPVRTVRIEGRQLHAVTYKQWGVMVYTVIYDDQGRTLEDAEYLPGGNPDIKTTFAYDSRGNEIERAHYTHDELTYRSTTRYDAHNRKLEAINFDEKGKQTSRFIFQYEKSGRQVRFELQADGKRRQRGWTMLNSRGDPLEQVEFDDRGSGSHRYVYTYDAAGNKTSDVDYYKTDEGTHVRKNTYVYNNRGDLIEEAYYPDGTLHVRKTHRVDLRGNKIESIEFDGKGVVKERHTWTYDFDHEGNWTRAVISEWTDKAPQEPFQPTYEYRRIFGRVDDATIALWSAARAGDLARVQEALRQGADVNAKHPDGGAALIKAADRGHQEILQALLAAGAMVDGRDAEGWTALMWSAERGRLELVNLLIAAGADPKARNEAGGVPIMPAALNGHVKVLKVLLEKGAEVNAAANDRSTALMVAAREGQTEALRFLLASGADPNLTTRDGLTALFFAVARNQLEAIRILLDKGVDVNARAKAGATPLMLAAGQSEPAVLQLLIEKGADINAATDDGRTALSIAVQANRKEAIDLLRRAGAK